MLIPDNLFYKKSHEWAEFLPGGLCRVGISDFAQSAMGDIVFVNLPSVGDEVTADEALCDIESVKAVSDVFSPVSGTIKQVNDALSDEPQLLNSSPYDAWIAVIETGDTFDGLMDADAYRQFCESEENS
ncbi:MAG: glycine cleavage system protein GcvH [Clostridia bacterium]|nr:glycine cleavage system protein GcvH [Clostridia bacterium]